VQDDLVARFHQITVRSEPGRILVHTAGAARPEQVI
jgi:G3E family GTPase